MDKEYPGKPGGGVGQFSIKMRGLGNRSYNGSLAPWSVVPTGQTEIPWLPVSLLNFQTMLGALGYYPNATQAMGAGSYGNINIKVTNTGPGTVFPHKYLLVESLANYFQQAGEGSCSNGLRSAVQVQNYTNASTGEAFGKKAYPLIMNQSGIFEKSISLSASALSAAQYPFAAVNVGVQASIVDKWAGITRESSNGDTGNMDASIGHSVWSFVNVPHWAIDPILNVISGEYYLNFQHFKPDFGGYWSAYNAPFLGPCPNVKVEWDGLGAEYELTPYYSMSYGNGGCYLRRLISTPKGVAMPEPLNLKLTDLEDDTTESHTLNLVLHYPIEQKTFNNQVWAISAQPVATLPATPGSPFTLTAQHISKLTVADTFEISGSATFPTFEPFIDPAIDVKYGRTKTVETTTGVLSSTPVVPPSGAASGTVYAVYSVIKSNGLYDKFKAAGRDGENIPGSWYKADSLHVAGMVAWNDANGNQIGHTGGVGNWPTIIGGGAGSGGNGGGHG